MRLYSATLQFRTTLDQAGQIAGLAGELEVSESDVCRRLVEAALEEGSGEVRRRLAREIARERTRDREALEQLARDEGSLIVQEA